MRQANDCNRSNAYNKAGVQCYAYVNQQCRTYSGPPRGMLPRYGLPSRVAR